MGKQNTKYFLEEHHQASFGWALACCNRNKEDAEDVLQTVYLKIMDGKAVFHGNSNFKTWLFGVIRNTAIDLYRKKQLRSKHRCLFQYQEEQTHASSDPAIQTEQNHELSILVKALSSLPKRQKEVLYLVFYQGLTIEEAGKVLKISLGSARKHYERGKMNLRKSLLEWRATA